MVVGDTDTGYFWLGTFRDVDYVQLQLFALRAKRVTDYTKSLYRYEFGLALRTIRHVITTN